MLFHTVTHKWLCEKTKSINLIPLGDTHIGDPNLDDKLLINKIQEIKDTGALVMLTGDMINNGLKSSVSNCYEEAFKPSDQIKYLCKVLEPIKTQIIGAIEGNHERRTTKEVDQSPTEMYCSKLAIPYFGNEVFLKIRFGKQPKDGHPIVYGTYCAHGVGGGRLPGSKVNCIARMGQIVIADLYFMGHTHSISVHPEIIMIPDMRNGKVVEHRQVFVNTGGFLKREGYPAQKMLPPLELGAPTVILSGKEKEIKVIL